MGKRRARIPTNRSQENKHFILEKYWIEKIYPFLQCNLHRDRLTCHGSIIPSEGCDPYELKISYKRGSVPAVFITNPAIEPKTEYHMYKEGNLCLYDWREMPWRASMKMHQTIIPWTAEWLVFYELWRLTGEWLGAESAHAGEEKHPENES